MYKIDYYKWGIISIDGKEYKNDIKIYPDEIIPDWWRSIGHKLLGADIPELRGKNIDFLIVGCGAYGALQPGGSQPPAQPFSKHEDEARSR